MRPVQLLRSVLLAAAMTTIPLAATAATETAIFAGGCFWCMEGPFEKLPGVKSVVSGYTGGHTENPTYEQTSDGTTGHTEAVEVVFDPQQVSYEKLLQVFWRNIDPLVKNRQFCDQGSQYRAGVFYRGEEQKKLAIASRDALTASKRLPGPILTEITAAGRFYPAEDYHQDYYKKNPLRYAYYRRGCGRDARLEELWGKDAP